MSEAAAYARFAHRSSLVPPNVGSRTNMYERQCVRTARIRSGSVVSRARRYAWPVVNDVVGWRSGARLGASLPPGVSAPNTPSDGCVASVDLMAVAIECNRHRPTPKPEAAASSAEIGRRTKAGRSRVDHLRPASHAPQPGRRCVREPAVELRLQIRFWSIAQVLRHRPVVVGGFRPGDAVVRRGLGPIAVEIDHVSDDGRVGVLRRHVDECTC